MSNFRGQVQGFAVGAAIVAALMIGIPAALVTVPNAPSSEQVAADFGVTIVWSTAPCAVLYPGVEMSGCANEYADSVIFVSPELEPASERYVVLHEIAHVVHYRLGMPVDECAADRFAQSLGAVGGVYCAPTD